MKPQHEHLRIAAHNGAPEWGGAEIAVCRLLAGLRDRGHAVRLYYNRDVIARGAASFGLETEHLHVGGDGALHHGPKVALALRGWEPDVLVIGTFRKLLHLAIGARLIGVPVVSRIGMSTDVPRNSKYRFLFRNLVDRVVVNAQDIRRAFVEQLPDFPPEHVVVITAGYRPTASPSRSAARQALGLPENAFVIGALSRLVEQKRLDCWIDVVAALGGEVTGLVAGDGPLRDELEARAQLRQAPVQFLGHLDDPSIALAAMDVLLITSEREGLSNAMIEALAHGVPVVSTPVSGAREALGDDGQGAAGIVVDGFESAKLTAALEPLVRDPGQLARMAGAARRRAASRFDEATMLDRWESVLADAVSRRRS